MPLLSLFEGLSTSQQALILLGKRRSGNSYLRRERELFSSNLKCLKLTRITQGIASVNVLGSVFSKMSLSYMPHYSLSTVFCCTCRIAW